MNCRLCALCRALALAFFPLRLLRGQAHHPRFPLRRPPHRPFPPRRPHLHRRRSPLPRSRRSPPVPTPTEPPARMPPPVGAQLPGAWNDREAQVSFGMSPARTAPGGL